MESTADSDGNVISLSLVLDELNFVLMMVVDVSISHTTAMQ